MKEQPQVIEANSFSAALQEQLIELEAIRTGMQFLPPMPKKQHVLLQWVRKIPLLTGFGNNVAGAGLAILGIEATLQHPVDKMQSWSSSFQIAALVLALIDFIRVPAIYLTAWLLGEKVPVSTPKNARWLQASILLSFAVMALMFPATAGPTGLIGACLGFGVSFLNLGRFFYRKFQVAKQLKQICLECENAIKVLIALQNEAIEIYQSLLASIRQADTAETQTLIHQASGLLAQFNQQKSLVQTLWSTQCRFEQKQVKRGFVGLMDKIAGVTLASLGLLGTVMTLFFPLSGLIILAGTAAVGTIYISMRVSYPWLKNKGMNSSIDQCRQAEEKTVCEAVDDSEKADSTMKMFKGLSGCVSTSPRPTSRGLTAGSRRLSTSLDPAVKPREVGRGGVVTGLTPIQLKAPDLKLTPRTIQNHSWTVKIQNSVLSLYPEPSDQLERIKFNRHLPPGMSS